ncbi:hypothetical protein [Roseibium sp.]|uniref:hypothetical protein n=1 Tax=Roseibium sp. TaxID=1936156 RepID=UPI003A96A014
MAKAKAYSDFLGFHVRAFFCFLIAQVLIIRDVERVIATMRQGGCATFQDAPLDWIVAAIFYSYGIAMFIFILVITATFFKGRAVRVVWFPISLLWVGLVFLAVNQAALFAAAGRLDYNIDQLADLLGTAPFAACS